jgi:catechol 2,3-dioxygenase-like lactoylglutathione lyase family enzyme
VRLNHVTVTVTEIERSVAFYELLGLEQIVANYPTYARFVSPEGDTTLSLHGLAPASEPPSPSVSLHFECDDVDGKVAELKAKGVTFDMDPTDQPYLWREAILSDPDGNRIFLFSAGENRLNPPWRLPKGE